VSEPADTDRSKPAPAQEADAPAEATAGPRQVTLRRAPRYRAFVLTGVGLGVALAAVLTVVFPNNGDFSVGALFGYVAVVLALLLGVAGALLAVYLERPRRR
jgi:hypothetical protein